MASPDLVIAASDTAVPSTTPNDASNAAQATAQASAQAPAQDDSPEAKMSRRYPQKIRVGDLVGREVISDAYDILGRVVQVVRSPAGKIKLIVSYSRWFGWFSRPVAVPIELVGALGRQVGSIDMEPEEYRAAPTWIAGTDRPIPDNDIILIAIAKR